MLYYETVSRIHDIHVNHNWFFSFTDFFHTSSFVIITTSPKVFSTHSPSNPGKRLPPLCGGVSSCCMAPCLMAFFLVMVCSKLSNKGIYITQGGGYGFLFGEGWGTGLMTIFHINIKLRLSTNFNIFNCLSFST